MVLQATSDTWVQVRQSGVHVLLTRIMKAGDTWPVPAEPGLTLDTGNAGGLILEINGVPTPAGERQWWRGPPRAA